MPAQVFFLYFPIQGKKAISCKLPAHNKTVNTIYGFKDGTNTGNDYTYDENGNMISDANKGITNIAYNHLNLPVQVDINNNTDNGTISYIYDAVGMKLRKIAVDNNTSITATTDYAGNYVYENGSLKQITQPEGYIEPDGNGWQYVYRYLDIWGNTRVTYADDNGDGSVNSSEIRREQNFYPFGLEHKGYNTAMYGVKNNLKTYQGQEFTEDLGLNTHEWKYRMSDPTIGGRFWSIDPLAEDYSYQSPYNFSENDPVSGVELEGLEKLHVTVYNVMKNDSGGYTRSAPQTTSVTDNHDWKDGTHYESQYNVYGDDNKTVTAIHTGPEAGLNLSKSGVNITSVEGVDLSMGEVIDTAGNNKEFQKAGETAKNYVAGVGLAFGAGAIAAGEASFFTYLGLVSDANVVSGGENGSLTDSLNENDQKSATLVGTASAVGSKTEAVTTLMSTAATSSSKFSAAINLFKAIFDLSTMAIEKRNEENNDERQ
ncbi:RHS repeat domain-containing protein [Abyssalbus ytuae]|uniref:RHS repeat-associated core domain-containing protein n=1 Tax=Abyssalbus ytuae TaxID=2926907 RepID=A0A9E7D378_9FLAO|nr:hypothetical protein [Abyssalbus ytuae]UOB18998.1 hypothetical protein MQE35_06795 [Abyssalbus ytuae]